MKRQKCWKEEKKIAGMPCLYTVSEDEAQTLHITLKDEVGGLRLHLYYTVMDELDVITRYVRLENTGDKKYGSIVYSAAP